MRNPANELLLSADIAPEVATNLLAGVNQLRDWAGTLASYQQLGQQLPVVNTALGTATDLSGWLQTRLVDPVSAYLSGGGTKTTDGLVAALSGVGGLSSVTGDQYGDEVRFDLVLDASRTLNGLDLSVPQTSNGMAITASSVALDLLASLHLDFAFGVDLTPGLALDDAFFLRFDSFTVAGDIHAGNLGFDLSLGFLGAQVSGGSVDLNADLAVQVANPDAGRGGVGSRGAVTKEDDFTEQLFIAHAHNYLLIFTEQGQVHWKRVYEIPEGNKTSKGRAVQNLINIQPGDNIKAILKITNLEDEEYLSNNFVILCTENGTIKKTSLEAYSRPRQGGITAITIHEGDKLLNASLTNGKNDIVIAKSEGKGSTLQ